MEEYLNSILYTSDFPSGRYNLANYYSRKGDLIKAEKYYSEAISMDNLLYPAKSNLALLYYSQGKLKQAEKLFIDLINNHTEYSEGNYYLGLLYAEQGKYREAANSLEKAVFQKDANPRAYYNLGLIYQYLKENKKAESALLKCNSLVPNNFDFIYALSDYYLKQKDYSRALQYANELKLKFPSKPEGQSMINYINNQMNSL
jgi:tetratricopeptide (TPR) repeat protein